MFCPRYARVSPVKHHRQATCPGSLHFLVQSLGVAKAPVAARRRHSPRAMLASSHFCPYSVRMARHPTFQIWRLRSIIVRSLNNLTYLLVVMVTATMAYF